MLVAVALFLAAVEIGTRAIVQKASRIEYRVDAEYAVAKGLRRTPDAKQLLVVGNSLLLFDVQFDSLRRALSPQWASNRLVLEQTNFLDWYYGLRQLLAKGASPDAVALVLAPDQLVNSQIRGDYSVYRLMGTRDAFDAARELHVHPTIAARYLLSSVSAAYGLRSEYRKVLLGRLIPDMATLTPRIAHEDRAVMPDSEVYQRAFERLARLKALLDARNTKLVFVLPPVKSMDRWNQLVQRAGADADVPIVVPFDRTSFSDVDYQSDGYHMNEGGARRYTSNLVSLLRSALTLEFPPANDK
jgi:hypothetical protein